jgi:hypothetical protein
MQFSSLAGWTLGGRDTIERARERTGTDSAGRLPAGGPVELHDQAGEVVARVRPQDLGWDRVGPESKAEGRAVDWPMFTVGMVRHGDSGEDIGGIVGGIKLRVTGAVQQGWGQGR